MYPVDAYRITPNLFGRQRWQAEARDQKARFARRAYSAEAAHMKMALDEEGTYRDRFLFMQEVWLPLSKPLYLFHDKLCREVEAAKRRRYSRKYRAQNR